MQNINKLQTIKEQALTKINELIKKQDESKNGGTFSSTIDKLNKIGKINQFDADAQGKTAQVSRTDIKLFDQDSVGAFQLQALYLKYGHEGLQEI